MRSEGSPPDVCIALVHYREDTVQISAKVNETRVRVRTAERVCGRLARACVSIIIFDARAYVGRRELNGLMLAH